MRRVGGGGPRVGALVGRGMGRALLDLVQV